MSVSFPHAYLLRPLDPQSVAEKRQRKRCVSWGCRRRSGKKRGGRCETCASRLWRLKNDDRYAYHNLKVSARKRRIPFHLTFEDFQEFCATTGYLELRGIEPHCYTVDRIKTDRPYQAGNLRLLTNEENASHKYEEYADKCRARRVA